MVRKAAPPSSTKRVPPHLSAILVGVVIAMLGFVALRSLSVNFNAPVTITIR